MRFVRRLFSICVLIVLSTAVSGCVVRPLWWGGHGSHGYSDGGGRSGHHSERTHGGEYRGGDLRRGRP